MEEWDPAANDIFLESLNCSSEEERTLFIEEACAGDSPLRTAVLALLRAHFRAGSFLQGNAATANEMANEQVRVSTHGNSQFPLVHSDESVMETLRRKSPSIPRVVLQGDENDGTIEKLMSKELPPLPANSRYQLHGEIARGGMGAILKGRDCDLGRDLAIKVLLDSHKDTPETIERFVEEAQIGGQLQHPGIVPVHELGRFADDRPFFSMKLIKGETLATHLAERREFTDDRAKLLGIFEQICQTMAYAHSRRVIHRDLKPANVMVGAFGEVQVMDWGLAKVLNSGGIADECRANDKHVDASVIHTRRNDTDDSGSKTRVGSIMGTPAYMSPEQARGETDQMDERADVFSLGAVLCEILTGKPPYLRDSETDVYEQAKYAKLDTCLERLENCGADRDLVEIATKAISPKTENRWRDARELAHAVTTYLRSVQERLKQSELARAKSQVKRRLSFVVAGLSVSAAVSGWLDSRRGWRFSAIGRSRSGRMRG